MGTGLGRHLLELGYRLGQRHRLLHSIINLQRLTNYALRLTPYALRLTPYALRLTNYELRPLRLTAFTP
jgi:hypothetical protein